MCPVESPAGAEPPAAGRFSRTAAHALAGIAPPDLTRWEQALERPLGPFSLADLVALAVLAQVSRRVGWRVDEFGVGAEQLFAALAATPDVEQLDAHLALIGRDFARLAKLESFQVRCNSDELIVVPLGPILAALRDRAFA